MKRWRHICKTLSDDGYILEELENPTERTIGLKENGMFTSR